MPRCAPTQDGYREARVQVERFVEELLDEASRIAERSHAEGSSAAHVREAARHLYARGRDRTNQGLVALGSLVAGSAGSALAALILAESPPAEGLAASAVFIVVGTALATAGLFRS